MSTLEQNELVLEQAPPIPNKQPGVWGLVIGDMTARNEEGIRKHNTPLQPFNSRRALVDAYQEKLDDIVYTRQCLIELESLRDALIALAGDCLGWGHASVTEDLTSILQKHSALLNYEVKK